MKKSAYEKTVLTNLNFILLFSLILILLFLNLPHLLELTPVWPDESIFGDIALNLLKTGQLSTELWKGMMPGATQHVFWYPPIFFYLLASWFKIIGFSIVIQRLFSLLISVLYISIFFVFAKSLIYKEAPKLSATKVSLLAFLGSLLLIIDPTFLKSSVISRPEVLVLVLITSSAMLILKSSELKMRTSLRMMLLAVSGLLLSIAVLVHFLAGIFLLALAFYLIVISSRKFLLDKGFYLFIVSVSVPIIVWFLAILPDIQIFKSQLEVVSQGRNLIPNWLILSFSVLPSTHRITFLIYLVVNLTLVVIYLLTRKSYLLLISLISAAAWISSYFGQIEWYAVYITPFIYVTLILLFIISISKKKSPLLKSLNVLVVSALSIILILAVNNYINITSIAADQSYLEFLKNVKSSIPKWKTVFLSSIPDTYYAFKSDDSYRLYEFPMAKTNQEDFKRLLRQLDYVVINSPLSNMYVGNALDSYLQENAEEAQKITGGGYSVFVYKLKKQKNSSQY